MLDFTIFIGCLSIYTHLYLSASMTTSIEQMCKVKIKKIIHLYIRLRELIDGFILIGQLNHARYCCNQDCKL